MKTEEIKSNLCYYDQQNPNNNLEAFDETDRPQPRNKCACDNCFNGRDVLALQILNTQCQLTAERDLADRLARELEPIAWSVIQERPTEAELAIAAWKEARGE